MQEHAAHDWEGLAMGTAIKLLIVMGLVGGAMYWLAATYQLGGSGAGTRSFALPTIHFHVPNLR